MVMRSWSFLSKEIMESLEWALSFPTLPHRTRKGWGTQIVCVIWSGDWNGWAARRYQKSTTQFLISDTD